MRIVVVNNFYPPRVGGSSHLSNSLAEGYAAAGHEVLVITAAYRDAPTPEVRDGLRIIRLPAWSLPRLGTAIDFDVSFALGPRNVRTFFRELDDFKPDVLHVHGQFLDLSWIASHYARRRKLPMLLSVHTRLESTYRSYDLAFRILDRLMVRPLILRGRPTFVVMDRLMDQYIDDRYHPPAAGKIPIPVGVETTHEPVPGRVESRAALDIGDGPLIVSVGHVIPLRDRLTLVASLPSVRRKYPNVKLYVVGDVNYPAFLELAKDLGVDGCITCTGAVNRSNVRELLAAADVETHDLQGLGLGTASLEAMYARVPVIAAVGPDNFPGIELRSEDNITLVKVGDPEDLAAAICRRLDDRAASSVIADNQHELVVKHFAMTTVVVRHIDELEKLSANAAAMKNRQLTS